MIKSILFKEDYTLILKKESQRRFGFKTIKPKVAYNGRSYDRIKNPYDVFYLFKKGLKIDLKPDVNVIVGDNGSGKSTLFSLMKDFVGKEPDQLVLNIQNKTREEYMQFHRDRYDGPLEVDGYISFENGVFFSAEHDNPVVAIPELLNPNSRDFMGMTLCLFDAQEESHGESLKPILEHILKNGRNLCIFMDEPETALSLRNQVWLGNELKRSSKENKNQIFLATHALALINMFTSVYDMEERMWKTRDDYINKIFYDS